MSRSSRSKKGREAPRTNPLPALISAVIVVVLFVGLGIMLASNQPGANPVATQPTADTFSAEPTPAISEISPTTAIEPGNPAKTYNAPPPMTIDPKKNYTATITTPRGDFVIKLRPDLAPETVNSFVFLAKDGFYNGVTWHRVLPDFMAQGGDPTGTGTGGPGYTLPDEFTNQVSFNKPGIVAMANTGQPHSSGSQFFVTTAPAEYLDGKYTIFGEVTQGQDIVDGIPLRDPEQNPAAPGEQIVKVTIGES